jgi:DNA invertase Pin-like site-specific DNA recombinase
MNEPTFAQKPEPREATANRHRNADLGPCWVCYFRVSTTKQGESGLGLDAQRDAVTGYIAAKGGTTIAEFTEVESGKKACNRPELQKAMDLSRKKRATLVIAKLDRLARNVHFISGLMESGVEFVAVDQPTKDRFMLHLQAAFAEEEARRISQRTKEAMAAAKRRGAVIGATGRERANRLKAEALDRAKEFAPLISELRASGFVQVRQIRDELNRRGVPSPGGARWHLLNTHKTLARLGMAGRDAIRRTILVTAAGRECA